MGISPPGQVQRHSPRVSLYRGITQSGEFFFPRLSEKLAYGNLKKGTTYFTCIKKTGFSKSRKKKKPIQICFHDQKYQVRRRNKTPIYNTGSQL